MVKYISTEKIETLSSKILRECEKRTEENRPVDVAKIAKKLGCNLELVDFDPKNISARVVKKPNDTMYTIQIARGENIKRQRFSIAHEIAHIILHAPDDDGCEFIELRQSPLNYKPDDLYKETQANMFAAALLLPKKEILSVWNSTKDIEEISDIFNVSKEVVYNRLYNLGVLESE